MGPIVIGGIGGSGTRVVAEILQMLDICIGDDLNESLDNLTYTLLFKRKGWYYRNRDNKHQINRGLSILEKTIVSPAKFNFRDYLFIAHAILGMSIYGNNRDKAGSGYWPIIRAKKIFDAKNHGITGHIGWGWKEPNSSLIIEYLNDFFPDLKYIHCLRNGLDMAFSANQQQLFNWGPLFGIKLPTSHQNLPEASFRYWVKATKLAINAGLKLDPSRFLLVNFDQLCNDPKTGVNNIIDFLGLKPDEHMIHTLTQLPKLPVSSGRYRDRDISWLSSEDRYFMKTLGFKT